MILVQTLQTHRMSYLVDVPSGFDRLIQATEIITGSINGKHEIDPLTSSFVSEEVISARTIDKEEIHGLIRETNDIFGD
jgi:hypothetical protein